MDGALGRPPPGQREVEPALRPLPAALAAGGVGEPRLQQRLQHALGLVGGSTHHRPLVGRQGAERAEKLGERALAAEEADADGLQLGRRRRALDRLAGLAGDGVDARVIHGLSAPAPWRSR